MNIQQTVDVFFLDTPATTRSRIAAVQQSLPNYIILDEKQPETSAGGKQTFWFTDLLTLARSKMGISGVIASLIDTQMIGDYVKLYSLFHDITNDDLSVLVAKKLDRHALSPSAREYESSKLTSSIKQNQENQRWMDALFSKLQSTKPIAEPISERIVKQHHRIPFVKKATLFTIFDDLYATPDMPIITFANYYKFDRYGASDAARVDSSNEHITIVCAAPSTEIKISQSTDGDDKFIVLVELDKSVPRHLYEEMLSEIQSLLKIPNTLAFSDETVRVLTKEYTLNIPPINMFGLSDMILTRDNIFNIISANDNRSSDALSRTFYLRYSTVMIEMRAQQTAAGTTLTVRARTDADQHLATELFGRLITLHTKTSAAINQTYAEFKISLSVAAPKERRTFLRKAEDVFFADYKKTPFSRRCQPTQRHPIVVNPGDEHLYEGLGMLKYPRETVTVNPEGRGEIEVEPKVFVCLDDKYKYPGLLKNLNNAGVQSPCCFMNAHEGRMIDLTAPVASAPAASAPAQRGYTKITNKVLEFGEIGEFSRNYNRYIFECLNSIPSDATFVRFGMDVFPSSLLECVLVAVDESFVGLESSVARINYVNSKRQTISRAVNPSLLAQEFSRSDDIDIVNYLQDINEYFDPAKVCRLIEEVFNINLFCFYREAGGATEAGTVLIPHHTHGYIRFEPDSSLRSVFLFVHKEPNYDYPQCELITTSDGSSDLPENVQAFLFDIYDALCPVMANVKSIVRKLPPGIVAQHIDMYGKVRKLLVQTERGDNVVLLTSPLPPTNVPRMTDQCPSAAASPPAAFLNYPDAQIAVDNLFDEKSNQDFQQTFTNNDKIARWMTNWVLYLFSQYLREEGMGDIKEFVRQQITVRETFIYGHVGPFFTKIRPSGIFYHDKLVCTDTDMVHRLMYQLRVLIERERDKIIGYADKLALENYYAGTSDFQKHDTESLLYINSEQTNWPRATNFTIHTEPDIYRTDDASYLFSPIGQEWEITDQIFLTKNLRSFDDALFEYNKWHGHAQLSFNLFLVNLNGLTDAYVITDDDDDANAKAGGIVVFRARDDEDLLFMPLMAI